MTLARPVRGCRAAREFRPCCDALEDRRLLNASDLDPSFGGDGVVAVTFPGGTFSISDVAVQLDGKVVVAGRVADHGAVARLNADGTRDSSFGGDGLLTMARLHAASGVAIQADGKIVLCGAGERDNLGVFGVARLLPDGSTDTGFADGGFTFNFFDYSGAEDLAIQRDGKIVVAGWVSDVPFWQDPELDFAVARFNVDGSLDGSFNFDGRVSFGFGHDHEQALGVAIDYNGTPQSNPYYGTVVVAGGRPGDTNSDFHVARLTPGGLLDTRFDDDGKLSTPFPAAAFACATGVVIQPGGKVVATGFVGDSESGIHDTALARYLPNGDLDPTFGAAGAGWVVNDWGFNEVPRDVVTNHMGGLTLAAGSFAIAYTRDGRPDMRFGGDGLALLPSGAANGIAVAPGRRLVVGGGFSVARFFDVAPVVAFLSFDTVAHEAGPDTAAFLVVRDAAADTPLRVYLSVGGTATPPGVRNADYTGFVPASPLNPEGGYIDIPAGQTFNTVIITPVDDALAEPDETATFALRPNDEYDLGTRPDLTLTIKDNEPPAARVTQVFLNGQGLTGQSSPRGVAFRTLAGVDRAYGYRVPAGANQTKPIPWSNGIDRVAVRFDRDMTGKLDLSDLAVHGVAVASYRVSGFTYNALDKTGVWTLSTPIENDRVRLFLDDVKGGGLDGEWADGSHTYPSGDGISGGDFNFRVNVLRGDANQDGVVNTLDVRFVRQRLYRDATNPGSGPRGYSVFADLNADGAIDVLDLTLVRLRLGTRLPAGEPTSV